VVGFCEDDAGCFLWGTNLTFTSFTKINRNFGQDIQTISNHIGRSMDTKDKIFVAVAEYQTICRIYSRTLRTFFPSLAAEKSRCVKNLRIFFCGGLDLGFILV
jgi:hypothetical protein